MQIMRGPVAGQRARTYRVFVRDLVLAASIGVHAHEHARRQRVRVNMELEVAPGVALLDDDLRNTVCYGELTGAVRALAAGPHIQLAETLAERILELCLADERVRFARVTVEKLDVYGNGAVVGVEMARENL